VHVLVPPVEVIGRGVTFGDHAPVVGDEVCGDHALESTGARERGVLSEVTVAAARLPGGGMDAAESTWRATGRCRLRLWQKPDWRAGGSCRPCGRRFSAGRCAVGVSFA